MLHSKVSFTLGLTILMLFWLIICLFFCLTVFFLNLFKQITLCQFKWSLYFPKSLGVPKELNKSSQSFWPLLLLTTAIMSPGSQSWLPSSLWQSDWQICCSYSVSAGRECLLDMSSILFLSFSSSTDPLLTCLSCVWATDWKKVTMVS